MPDGGWTRRRILRLTGQTAIAVVGLGGAGYAGYRLPHSTSAASGSSDTPRLTAAGEDVVAFQSRPDLRPPRLTTTRVRGARVRTKGTEQLFLAPKGYSQQGPGQQGLLISDWRGNPVWFLPRTDGDAVPMNFRTQRYQGKPVLTWWQGKVLAGHGAGECLIYDQHYRQIATVRAGNGLHADLHEFLLTPQGTALITAYRATRTDTSALGGPKDGWVYSGVVQEIDVASGQVRFEWDSLDHIGVAESYQGIPGDGSEQNPFDYFHVNSIDLAPNGDLVISARNTSAIYQLSHSDGSVRWRLGGRRSDFTMGRGTRFYWQHDARVHSGNRISLFDDGSSPAKEKESRGLVLSLDTAAKRVSVARQFTHPARLLADNQGNLQLLPDGRALVGWGAEPYTSLFDAHGKLVMDARFPANDQSYRAFTDSWVGTPHDNPSVTLGPNQARGVTVYVSWNGATEVARWQVLAGATASTMAPVAEVPVRGFETVIAVASDDRYFAAVALDTHGKALGRSAPVKH